MTKPTHPAILEALAVHEAFRRLHFTPEEIFVGPHNGTLMVAVRRNGLQFLVDVGACTREDFLGWPAAAEWWNGVATDLDQRRIYRSSRVFEHRAQLAASLISKGFCVQKVNA